MAFYLTLPSTSSSEYFPNNKAGHYNTQLPQTIELEENFEVGLSEIQFSSSFITIKKEECWFTVKKQGESMQRFNIDPGLFPTNTFLVEAINKKCQINREADQVYLRYDEAMRTVRLRIMSGWVMFSPTLARLLGFKEKKYGPTYAGPREYIADSIMDLNEDFHSTFVYCDLVSQRTVGNTLAPLLRIVPTSNKERDIVHCIYQTPHYVPVSRNSFNTVEILLKNHLGETLSFASGQTILTLHFRPKL